MARGVDLELATDDQKSSVLRGPNSRRFQQPARKARRPRGRSAGVMEGWLREMHCHRGLSLLMVSACMADTTLLPSQSSPPHKFSYYGQRGSRWLRPPSRRPLAGVFTSMSMESTESRRTPKVAGCVEGEGVSLTISAQMFGVKEVETALPQMNVYSGALRAIRRIAVNGQNTCPPSPVRLIHRP